MTAKGEEPWPRLGKSVPRGGKGEPSADCPRGILAGMGAAPGSEAGLPWLAGWLMPIGVAWAAGAKGEGLCEAGGVAGTGISSAAAWASRPLPSPGMGKEFSPSKFQRPALSPSSLEACESLGAGMPAGASGEGKGGGVGKEGPFKACS